MTDKVLEYLKNPKLKAIANEYRNLDKKKIEARVRQGELLEDARGHLKPEQSWMFFVEKVVGTDMTDAHRSLRCYEAAKRVGLNTLLSADLSAKAIWYLVAPDVPEEALLEALELSKTEKVTAARAEQIALRAMNAKKIQRPKRKSRRPRPEKVELEPTPEAFARYICKTFTDEETDRFIDEMGESPLEKEDTRSNSAPMSRAVDWVQHAQAKRINSDQSVGLNAYLIRDGRIYASDGVIFAAAPFPHDGPILVPSHPFRPAVRGEPDFAIGDGELVLTQHDGSISRMPTLPIDKFPEFREPAGDYHPLNWKARTAIRRLAPFCSEDTSRPEAMGVWLNESAAVVVNGKTKLMITGTRLESALFLPVALIKFINSQRANPIELVLQEGWVWLIWDDGSWAGAKQVELRAEEEKILDTALAELRSAPEPSQKLSEEWQSAFEKIKGTGAERALIYADRMEGTYKSGVPGEEGETCRITIPVKTAIPTSLTDNCLRVPVRLIEPALRVADAIDFAAYPDAVAFSGETVVGLVELPKPAGA